MLVCILGPNGVGKSTLIHCINKILTPQKGSVCINMENIEKMNLMDVAKHVGYVPQGSPNMFPITVMDMVMMGRHPHSSWWTREKDFSAVEDIMKLLGIETLAMRSFDELSAGQRQKVLIARGLVQEPEIMLLDEPTSNLDIKHQLDVMEIMSDWSKKKDILVIMACHDLNISARYADLVVMMKDGRIFDFGAPLSVFTKENIHNLYGVEADIFYNSGKPFVLPLRCVKE